MARRKCDPNKCDKVLKERRVVKCERRKRREERIIRDYYEREAALYQKAIQELVRKMFAEKVPHKMWDKIKDA